MNKNNVYSGSLITFEGLDFCGNSTQVKLLCDKLESYQRLPLLIREPGGTTIGEKLREMLLDKNNTAMTQATEMSLFNGSRSQLVHEVITPALNDGMIVLCDRFYDSTTAYQGFGRGMDLDYILKTNIIVTGGLVPDITFFIEISVDEMEKRYKKSGMKKDRMELLGAEFYEHVLEGYHWIAEKEPDRFKIIDGMRSIDIIHEDIVTHFKSIKNN